MTKVLFSTSKYLDKYDQTRLALIFKYHSVHGQKLQTSSLLENNVFLMYIKKTKLSNRPQIGFPFCRDLRGYIAITGLVPLPPLITNIMCFEVTCSHTETYSQTPKLTEKVKTPQGRV